MNFWKITGLLFAMLITLAAISCPALASSVSGTVTYGGSKTGRVYLYLEGSNGLGTSVASAGSGYTINGVPDGNYTLYAFMDTVGNGMRHAADPRGMLGSIVVAGGNLTSHNINLADPSTVTPVAPDWLMAFPADGGALIQWGTPKNDENLQIADSYNVYWSTSSSFTPVTASGSKTDIPANDNNFFIAGGLSNGTAYYFLVTAKTGANTSTPSSIYGPVTIGAPAGGYTVSVPVNLNGVTPTGPLYLAISDDAGKMFPKKITSPISQTYTVPGVQNGTYFVHSFIDMNDNGIQDTGDIRPGGDGPVITVSGGPVTSPGVTFSYTSASTVVQTQHFKEGTFEGYSLNFNVEGMMKQPVSVTLTGGTAAITYPVDIGLSQEGGFSFNINIPSRPATGNTYTFTINYSQGSPDTGVQAAVTGVLDTFPVPLSPLGATGGPGSATPTFSWDPPSPLPSGEYTYSLWLSSENSMNMWYVDSMPSSQTQAAYNFNGEASQESLSVGTQYRWGISVRDSFGNKADSQSSFTVTSGITFSGSVVDSNGPVVGATVAMDGYPSVSTVTGTGGTFSLGGLPVGSNFMLKASKDGYLPVYSQVLNSPIDITDATPFRLFTQGELTYWGVTTGNGAIAATVVDSVNPNTSIGGAVVTATNQGSNPYPVTYFDGSGFGGASTFSNGLAFVINVTAGDTVTLHAAKPGWSFTDAVLPIHANSVSEALLFGTYMQKTLSTTITGDGSGSVNSISPAGFSCSSGTCNAQFNTGTSVTLAATPGSGSLFGGWSGVCTNTIGDCTVTMDSDKTITATFNKYPPVYIEGGNYFNTLQLAFDSRTSSSFTVRAQDVELTGNLTARNGNTVTLKGGYDSIFNQKISGGATELKGILTLATGSLTVEDLVIK